MQEIVCKNCGEEIKTSLMELTKCPKCGGNLVLNFWWGALIQRIYALEETLRQHGIYED